MHEPVVIELGNIPPAEIRGNSRAHRNKKSKAVKDWRKSGYWHGLIELLEWRVVPRVSLQFAFHHWRKVDLDNLLIGMKPWIDGMVDAEVVQDDTPEHVILEAPTFHCCKKGQSKTVVTVREITP